MSRPGPAASESPAAGRRGGRGPTRSRMTQLRKLQVVFVIVAIVPSLSVLLCSPGKYDSGDFCVDCPAGFTSLGGALRVQSCLPIGTLVGPADTMLAFTAEQFEGTEDYNILPSVTFEWTADRFGRAGGAIRFPTSPARLIEHKSPAGRVPVGSAPRTIAMWIKMDSSAYNSANPRAVDYGA